MTPIPTLGARVRIRDRKLVGGDRFAGRVGTVVKKHFAGFYGGRSIPGSGMLNPRLPAFTMKQFTPPCARRGEPPRFARWAGFGGTIPKRIRIAVKTGRRAGPFRR